jgi:lysophospholipase L1-like esterase
VQLFRRAVLDGKRLTFVGTQMNGPDSVEGQPFPKRHEGRGGFTIDSDQGHSGISGGVTDNAMAAQTPHIVLLMIGTNDLNGNVDVAAAPTRLGNLIDQITDNAPDALVVVATIVPMENGNGSKVAPYNAAMADLIASRVAQGKHVIGVDNHAAFTADSNYASAWMGDALHPNDAGYAVLGDSFYEAIADYVPAP